MSHDSHQEERPKLQTASGMWLGLIVIFLAVATLNYVREMGGGHGAHGGHGTEEAHAPSHNTQNHGEAASHENVEAEGDQQVHATSVAPATPENDATTANSHAEEAHQEEAAHH